MTMFFSLAFLAQKYRVSWFVLGQCWDYMLASTLPAGASDPHWDSLGWIKTSASDFGRFWHRPPKKKSMNRISRNGSIINTYQHPHTSMVNQCESSRFDGEALNRRRFTGLQYCWKGNLPSNNETWLTGKSPINEGFNGKIIYKISTVQYTSWFSIAVLV